MLTLTFFFLYRDKVKIFGKLKINGTLEVQGDLEVWGNLTINGYLYVSSISLLSHNPPRKNNIADSYATQEMQDPHGLRISHHGWRPVLV